MGMKLVVGLLLACLLGVVVWYFMNGDLVIRNYPPQNSTIVAFGDSLIFGVGATNGNDFVSKLSVRIGRPILNLGVSGNTTADGVARMNDVEKIRPGLVLLLLGGNDTLRRIPIAETERNLRTLLMGFQKSGSVVMFLGVRGGMFGSEREDMYERLSEEYGAIYVDDVLDGILLKPELMFDGIHPNDTGYARIAERLTEVFKEYKL